MHLQYENQGNSTYLIYEISAGDTLDTMSLGMLTNNAIPGLAATSFMQMDTAKFIRFNISSKISVSQLFSGPVNKKRLIGVFMGVVDAMLSAEDYMLDPNMLLMDLDYIFTDVSTCETTLICLPINDPQHQSTDLGTFFKNIIFNTQFDQTENCDHVAEILNYLNSTPSLSLQDFKELLERIQRVNAPAKVQIQVTAQTVQRDSQSQNVQQNRRGNGQQTQQRVQNQQMQNHQMQNQQVQNQQVQNQQVQNQQMQNQQVQRQTLSQNGGIQQGNLRFGPNYDPLKHDGGISPDGRNVNQNVNQNRASTTTQKPEQEMSFFYLLQHYNKENAAIYKAQQEAKKARGGNGGKQPTGGVRTPGKQPQNGGFAVPGQQLPNGGFAVPGQQPPNGGFQVPGQQPPNGGFAVPGNPPRNGSTQGPGRQPQNGGYKVSGGQQPTVNKDYKQPGYSRPTQPPVQQPPVPTPDPERYAINFGETTVLSNGNGETTVLVQVTPQEPKPAPYLIRMKNNEKIPLNKPVFRIGKEKSYVDYFVGDNTAISRSHANIINRDGEYFIVDTNSTNHTYVNGGMIRSNVETRLTHGAKVRLANEEFEFKMY